LQSQEASEKRAMKSNGKVATGQASGVIVETITTLNDGSDVDIQY